MYICIYLSILTPPGHPDGLGMEPCRAGADPKSLAAPANLSNFTQLPCYNPHMADPKYQSPVTKYSPQKEPTRQDLLRWKQDYLLNNTPPGLGDIKRSVLEHMDANPEVDKEPYARNYLRENDDYSPLPDTDDPRFNKQTGYDKRSLADVIKSLNKKR